MEASSLRHTIEPCPKPRVRWSRCGFVCVSV